MGPLVYPAGQFTFGNLETVDQHLSNGIPYSGLASQHWQPYCGSAAYKPIVDRQVSTWQPYCGALAYPIVGRQASPLAYPIVDRQAYPIVDQHPTIGLPCQSAIYIEDTVGRQPSNCGSSSPSPLYPLWILASAYPSNCGSAGQFTLKIQWISNLVTLCGSAGQFTLKIP